MRNEQKNFDGLPCKREDCVLRVSSTRSTLLGWDQTFDRDGNPKDEDPNAHTDTLKCATCKTVWERIEKEGKENQWLEIQSDHSLGAAHAAFRGLA